jgi:hypothetical protein
MIQWRHEDRSLWDGVWAEEVGDLWEPWMRAADRLLEDDELLTKVFEPRAADGKRAARAAAVRPPPKWCCA